MKQKPDVLLKQCARWLQRHVSDVDYGWSHPRPAGVAGRHSAEWIGTNYRLRRRQREQKLAGEQVCPFTLTPLAHGKFFGLPPLRQKDIQKHLAKEETTYYTSRRSSNEALLMFDFDWHDSHKTAYGEKSDAMRAAQFIQTALFSEWNTYLESSTGGYGAHLYVRTDCKLVASRTLNADLETMTRRMRQMIANEEFLCEFCGIYGNFTVIEDGIVAKGLMGRLGKLPRPRTADQMRSLMLTSLIPYSAFSLASNDSVFDIILEDMTTFGGNSQKPSDSLKSDGVFCHPQADRDTPSATRTLSTESGEISKTQSPSLCTEGSDLSEIFSSQQDVYCEDGVGATDPMTRLRSITNPNQRMFESVFVLARTLNRPPTTVEALQFYESNGLNTGVDVKGRRVRRAEDAIRSCQMSFRPLHRRGVLRYLPLIKERLTEADLRASGCPRVVTFDDVAVALFIVTGRIVRRQPNPTYQHTVGQNYVMVAFQKLKATGLYTRLCDKRKWAAIKRLLLKSGLIEHTRGPGCYRSGRAEEFRLGPHHPGFEARSPLHQPFDPKSLQVQALKSTVDLTLA